VVPIPENSMMIDRSLRGILLLLAVTILVQPGCRPAAQPANPERAGAALREALDAWQKGESAEAYHGRTAVTVSESKWQGGARLDGYEMIGAGEMAGFDWQCRVRLSLQDDGGRKWEEKATYSVSTAPALVIVRSEGS
jgi:hypothetical protein